MKYWDIIQRSYEGAAHYLWGVVTTPFPEGSINGFYFLIVISLLIWGLEFIKPWRKNQAIIRKDFWLDAFYMFFNFYIFHLLLYAALSNVFYEFVMDLLKPIGYQGGHLIDFSGFHWGVNLFLYFIIADFVQWNVHRLLHMVPFLWKFHKVHHSVKEMGFAAHLRYHFLETFVYQTFKYMALSMLFGFDLSMGFIVYSITVLIGHLNHSNLNLDYGPLKYVFNNPKMHIWHHAKELPAEHPTGVNFGISLSLWDYLFKTSYIPSEGRDIELGFDDDEQYPTTFWGQLIQPFKKKR